MTEQMRSVLTPQDYILKMQAETVQGKFETGYTGPENDFIEETKTFFLNWTKEDAETLVERYNSLTSAFERIAKVHKQLDNNENIKNLLSEADIDIWNTYVRSYEPFEVDWDELYPLPPCEPDELMILIENIHKRGRCGDLIEEEELLLKRYLMWREEQSQKRIPFNRRSCAYLILRAMRYEKLLSLGAPEIIVTEEGRCLAEEMALYYFGKEEPIVWD